MTMSKKTNAIVDAPVGYTNEVYRIEKNGHRYRLVDQNGDVAEAPVGSVMRRLAGEDSKAIRAYVTKSGKKTYRIVDASEFNMKVTPLPESGVVTVEAPSSHVEIKQLIHVDSIKLKPRELVISNIKWKYLVRSAVRGKNIMMTGPSGCGKTMAAKYLVRQLNRPDFYFNLGATQDPRATLIGNTQFNKASGTYFAESTFVKAIKTPNAIILLDEMSRAHPDAANILMTVLDQNQRYLRLDEAEGSPIVKVAEGVTFIATANVGNEFTGTRVMDRALLDRFVTIEMDVLDAKEELELLTMMYPDVDTYDLNAIAEIASHTREVSRSEIGKLSNMVSTRASVEMASLVYDGFTLQESAEVSIVPFFSADGGLESERTYVRQLVQKYIKTVDDKLFDGLADTAEVVAEDGQQIVW